MGGESGEQARLCDYRWVLDIRRQCVQAQVPFYFMQTGARLLKRMGSSITSLESTSTARQGRQPSTLPAEQLPWQAF